MTESTGSDFEPTWPETFDSAHIEFARLRRECPVAHTEGLGGFWALLNYEDVKRAASDASTFITSRQNIIPKVAFTGRRPPLHLDPPEHTPYRRALNPLLTLERSEAFAPRTREITRELLQPLLERGRGDICADFSSYLPVHVFGEWMNMPVQWLDTLHESGRAFILAVHAGGDASMVETSLRLYDMARDLIAIRKKAPMDASEDPTSALLAARVDGHPLPDDMIVGTVRQILVVGMVAPMVMIGNIAVHLARDEALQQKLRHEPALIPDALEEFLRLYSPYRGFARTAVRDVEMSGRTIPADQPIALVYASANRDDTVFPNGDQFKIGRPNIAEHLAFGRGPHRCPGAHLGRMQLRVALEELLAMTRSFRLDGEIGMTRWPEIGAISVPLVFER